LDRRGCACADVAVLAWTLLAVAESTALGGDGGPLQWWARAARAAIMRVHIARGALHRRPQVRVGAGGVA